MRSSRRLRWTTAGIALVLAFVGLFVSPLALIALEGASDRWELLSWVGQSYGWTSAALSGLAFVGIAVSLILQSRETRAAREQGDRVLHEGLLRLSMQDPLYMEVWSGPATPEEFDRQRQRTYVNLVFSHWYSKWRTGSMEEPEVLRACAAVLQNVPGHSYWTASRTSWLDSGNRHYAAFGRIVDRAYVAVDEPPA